MRAMMATCDRCRDTQEIGSVEAVPDGWCSMHNPAYGRIENARPIIDLCGECWRGLVQYLAGTHYEVKLKPYIPSSPAPEGDA